MYPTKEIIIGNLDLNNSIRRLMATYLNEIAEKNVNEEDIVIDPYTKDIRISWEVNTACHCHPEIETKVFTAKFDEFYKWVEKNALELS